jgi:hypothetical protein
VKAIKMKTTTIITFVILFFGIHVSFSDDASDSLALKNFEGKSPFEILRNIKESPIFSLDSNGFTFQFGYNSVLDNIYGYFKRGINNIEDSLLLVYVKSIKPNNHEINVNKLPENTKNCLIYHFFDLMDKGKCKIIHNQNKTVISRIVSLQYLNRDRNAGGGRLVTLQDNNKIYDAVLGIADRK